MDIGVISILVLIGITIVLGYIGNSVYRKTRIPDVFWLLIFGAIVGPVLRLFERSAFVMVTPFLVTLAVLVILFDAGLNIKFYQFVRQLPRGTFLAVANLVVCILGVGFVAVNFFGIDLITGMLLGAIVGGTSSVIVLPILKTLKMDNRTQLILSAESIITDPLCIIIAVFFIDWTVMGQLNNPINLVLSSLSIGIVVGVIAGAVWLTVMDRIKGKPYDYILTLSILFLVYAFVEFSGGSGVIAALCFGLVLGNGHTFSKFFRFKKEYTIDAMVKNMQKEIAFFIRSFFFVFLGLLLTVYIEVIIYGLIVAAIVIVARIAVTKLSLIRYNIEKWESNMACVMAPRGLAAAVLAQMVVDAAIPNAELFTGIVFVVIFISVVYTSISTRLISKKKYIKKEERKHSRRKKNKKRAS